MAWRFDAAPVIRLGFQWKDRRKGEPVTFDPERQGHFELLAPPGCGKGASIEIPTLLLGLRGNVSVLSIDPSGQKAAVCAEARRRIGNEVLCLNPFGMYARRYPDLRSVGFNPLRGIDPRKRRRFLQDCQAVGEALIKQQGNDPHWSDSARGLITGIIMWEVVKADREGRAPLLEEVRRMLCEAEERNPDAPDLTDDEKKAGGRLTAGLRWHAQQMIASGHWQIADLAGRFVKEGSREIDSIISTARTQTEWLLSEPMRSDLRKNGIGDWARLLDRPTSCFVIVPAEYLETQEGSVWLRLVILAALRALYARAGRRKVKTVVFMLSEFAQLGKLSAIETARSQGRKYGVRLFLVLQDIHQLRSPSMYGPQGHESFAGQCGGVFAFAPGDFDSAEWMSRRSGEQDVPVSSWSQNDQGGRSQNVSLQRQRCWPPDEILDLRKYHGLLWLHGQSRAVPVYAEPYIDDDGNIRPEYLRAGARLDPYHSDDDGGDDDDEGDDFADIGFEAASVLEVPEVPAVAAPSRRLLKAGAAVAFAVIAALTVLAFTGHDWTAQPVAAPTAPVHPPPVHHHAVTHHARQAASTR